MGLATYIPIFSSKQHVTLVYPHFTDGKSKAPPTSCQLKCRALRRPLLIPTHSVSRSLFMSFISHITLCNYLVILSGYVSPLEGKLHEGRVSPIITVFPEPRTGAWKKKHLLNLPGHLVSKRPSQDWHSPSSPAAPWPPVVGLLPDQPLCPFLHRPPP